MGRRTYDTFFHLFPLSDLWGVSTPLEYGNPEKYCGVLILRSLRLPLVRKINTHEFSILQRTADPQKQVTHCFMIWQLNITHSCYPKRVYLAVSVSVITDRHLSDKIADKCV